MSSTAKIYKLYTKLKWLEPMLKALKGPIDSYIAATIRSSNNGDCPFFYNETAHMSLLAGAAWKKGLFAMTDYSADKNRERPGRADLYLWNGKKRELWIEAKQSWRGLKDNSFNPKKLLDDACEIARQGEASGNAMGLVFWTLKSGDRKIQTKHIIKDLCDEIKPQADLLYAYERNNPADCWWKEKGKRQYSPGFVLIGRIANR